MPIHDHSSDQEDILRDGDRAGLGHDFLFAEEKGGQSDGQRIDEPSKEEEDHRDTTITMEEILKKDSPLGPMDIGEHSEDVAAEKEYPEKYLRRALDDLGLDSVAVKIIITWIEGDYQYSVRIHKGERKYTNANYIYRVSRIATAGNKRGRGEGLQYLGTDEKWYPVNILSGVHGNGKTNSEESPASKTHIPLSDDMFL